MAEFLEYARRVRGELDDFLKDTEIQLQPALELVPCGFDAQHYVPAASLESHARRCHRAKRYSSLQSHAFFYRREGQHGKPSDELAVDEEEEPAVDSDSLVDPLSLQLSDSVAAALVKVAKDSSELYKVVHAWRRIPRAFAKLGLSGDVSVDRTKLGRWVRAELARLQELAPDAVDGEMVEYVLGLLEHPEFCHPDLVVVELEEFLGGEHARAFVAALWKFMVVDVGLRVLPTAASPPRVALPVVVEDTSVVKSVEDTRQKNADTNPSAKSSYKRRRPSYRAKNTRAGPYDLMREILAKSMAQLSEETGRELVEVPSSSTSSYVPADARKPWGRAVAEDWSDCTDALKVRDMGRECQQERESQRKSSSRRLDRFSQRRSRSRSRDRQDRWSGDHHHERDRERYRDGDRHRHRENGRSPGYDRDRRHRS